MANYPVTRDGTKSGGQHIFTLAAVPEVRIAIESLGAVADVAWSTGRVDAYTVHADAGVRISVFLRLHAVARVPDGPFDHHGHSPAVGVEEFRRCRVARLKIEAR